MANAAYIKTLIRSAFSAPQQAALGNVWEYLCGNLRLGRAEAGTRAENLLLFAVAGTTHATPDTEFSIPHGLGTTPYLVVPVLPLEVGAELVPLRVTRAPDASRIYLASSVASAPIRLFVEG